MWRRLLTASVMSWALVVATGCSGGSASVEAKGKLTWDDGKPITGANVRFVPTEAGKPEAVGFTDANGDFALKTQGKDGAAPGDYQVAVIKTATAATMPEAANAATTPEEAAAQMAKMMQQYKTAKKSASEVPDIYADPAKTPLTVKIEKSNQPIELKLKKS
jgi:hypothetical protein